MATVLVASAAWPLDAGGRQAGVAERDLRDAASRVRRGIALTFVAVVLLALGTSSSWWPTKDGADGATAAVVEVTTRVGVLCGELGTGDRGTLALDVAGRRVVLALADVVAVRATDGCDL